jgi:integrase
MSEYRIVTHRKKLALAYRDPTTGERIRRSLGTDDRGLAELLASRMWQASQPSSSNIPISEKVSDLWAAYIADRKKEIADISRLPSTWKALEPHFGYRIGSQIKADDCRAYYQLRKRQGMSNSTVKTELEYLRACLNRHYGKGNTHVWTPPASPPRDRYLEPRELEEFLAHVKTPHVRLFIILAVTTAARMGAILDLTWERVDFKHGTVNFNPAGRHQTDKRRVEVPMNSRCRAALEEAVKGALTDHVIEYEGAALKSIKKAIRETAKRSGVPCSPHVFRHTAGVWMAKANVPMQKISQFMGHTSTRVTERIYARYSPSHMRDAAAALDW